MKFLSNTFDPSHEDAPRYVVSQGDETPTQAWERHLRWLNGKTVGMPQATDRYSVSELIRMNVVGVYLPD